VEAWKNKEQRADIRSAALQHISAIAGGVKISGRAPKMTDFLPSSAKVKLDPALSEARLRVAMESWAAEQKPKKKKDK